MTDSKGVARRAHRLIETERLGRVPDLAHLFPRFRMMPCAVLLDSAAPHPLMGRYSYLTAAPVLLVRSNGLRIRLDSPAGTYEIAQHPLETLADTLEAYGFGGGANGADTPPFRGGVIGYWGYEIGSLIERVRGKPKPELGYPDMTLGVYDWTLARDNLTGEGYLTVTRAPNSSPDRADGCKASVRGILERDITRPSGDVQVALPMASTFTRQSYMTAVRRIKEYLAAGDAYQVNLSQRLRAGFQGDAWALYRHLREANPAPFGAFLDLPDVTVLSASPEEFLRLDGRDVRTRPIKGTRPRGATAEADMRLARELQASEKDRAENLMIVDLLRNDLGRVCETGSVRVPELFGLEQHPAVWHLVSTVEGRVAEARGVVDLLRAAFPGGSVTGAPKIRAMEIIDELEPLRRGVYCGAIGYISFTGATALSIPIRTMVLAHGELHLSVGGGVVADSDPAAEYEETLHKAEGLLRALR